MKLCHGYEVEEDSPAMAMVGAAAAAFASGIATEGGFSRSFDRELEGVIAGQPVLVSMEPKGGPQRVLGSVRWAGTKAVCNPYQLLVHA